MKEKEDPIIEEEENNNEKELSEQLLKEKRYEQAELKRRLEYSKERLAHQKHFYDDEINKKLQQSQKHLLDHKAEKKNPLVNITKKNLQTEYVNEVHYLFKKFIFITILSLLIFIETILILQNYKIYSEVNLSQIFSAFTFFNTIFLMVELYREALRDQFRHNLFRLFSIFLSIFNICLFITESMNIYIIYEKIQYRKNKCQMDVKFCGDTIINNIILVFNCIHLIGIFYFVNFPIWLGYRSFKILVRCDYEVYQKQLLENEKNEKKGKDDEKEKKGTLKDKKEHLKKE